MPKESERSGNLDVLIESFHHLSLAKNYTKAQLFLTVLSSFSVERAKLFIKFNQLLQNSGNHLDECLEFSSTLKPAWRRLPCCYVHRSIYHLLMIKNLHYPKPPISTLEMVNGTLSLAIRRHLLGFCPNQNSLSPENCPHSVLNLLLPISCIGKQTAVPQRASHFISPMDLAGGLIEANKAGS